MPTARERGSHWERCAESFLHSRGLKSLSRNVHCRFGEIDLVMLDGAVLVFVEVRYREVGTYGSGAESITFAKQRRLTRAAGYYLGRHLEHRHRPCRFDVVSMTCGAGGPHMDWIRDAFQSA